MEFLARRARGMSGLKRLHVVKDPLRPNPHGGGMVSRRRLKSALTVIGLYLMAGLMIGYFWFHAYSGNRGLRAKQDIDAQMAELSSELGRLKQERAQWDKKVALLRSDKIDPDMLDERARALLNYVHPNDAVLMLRRP
jgi:cell division protein FtsB